MVRIAIVMVCGVGLYASLFMLRKSRLAERGAVEGPSVVKEPHARLFFGVPNALIGIFYYPLLAAAVWVHPGPAVLAAAAVAGATSLFLAYSLLFVTKCGCPYCWVAHTVNWILLLLVPLSMR